jgi:DNA processing protein
VAIVGTREPSLEGAEFARELAAELAAAGVAILSGGAEGIDCAAHLGALQAGGVTVVVAPAGYLKPFPEQHAELFARVLASGGAYVSLVPPNRAATQGAFFLRNRCLVGLSQLVVVVQAPFRSGARNAAKYARRLGRPLFVVPSAPWIPEGRGCILEIKRGAAVCEGARDVLRALDGLGAVPLPPEPPEPPESVEPGAPLQESFDFEAVSARQTEADPLLELELLRVVEAIARGEADPDSLCLSLRLPAARIERALLTLRLRGVLVPGRGGGFVLSNSM